MCCGCGCWTGGDGGGGGESRDEGGIDGVYRVLLPLLLLLMMMIMLLLLLLLGSLQLGSPCQCLTWAKQVVADGERDE